MLFFFQAEDGIRDGRVTGVQTCALPISVAGTKAVWSPRGAYAFKLSNNSLGLMFPANRQYLARWIKEKPGQYSSDRKSTRLNSSHPSISYAVFCLKKKKTQM